MIANFQEFPQRIFEEIFHVAKVCVRAILDFFQIMGKLCSILNKLKRCECAKKNIVRVQYLDNWKSYVGYARSSNRSSFRGQRIDEAERGELCLTLRILQTHEVQRVHIPSRLPYL